MPAVVEAPMTSGLVSSAGARVPLVGVVARAEIRDYACRVVLAQRFRNEEGQPIEAVYRFPLDEGAAVCGFEVEIDGRVIKGHVEEREKAFETYDEALQQGHGAYLVDEERADVFTASVGNLPPGKEAVLRLTTVSELPLEGDAIRFTLPTAIAPRYAPAADRKGVGETEAERVTPPYAMQVPYGLTLEVDIRTTAAVRSVESPSHPVGVTLGDEGATVRLAEREAALDRDFVLKIALAETHAPRATVERAPDGHAYALLSFRPRLAAALAPAEVVFVVDRSGSMQGTSIAEARNALQLALRSLRPGCFFNVIGFGDRFESLFPASRAYDDASLAEATRHVKALEADLGGTEILPALESVLGSERRPGLPRQVFVLTDGEVTNTDDVIALGRRHAGHARIFTFGIGAGASHHLIRGLARAGEGEAEFIAPGERIEGKVMRQVTRALAPALEDVAVDWGGLAVVQSPFEVPPVFADGRVLVFGRIAAPRPAHVALRATGPDGPVAFTLPIGGAAVAEGTLVGTLWARRMIRDLEEGRGAAHAGRGSQQARAIEAKEDKAQAEIVDLAVAWNLASRHTSFVAVETRETPTEGQAQLRKVPVAITRGWHGLPMMLPAPAGFACAAPADDMDMAMDAESFRGTAPLPRPAAPARGGARPGVAPPSRAGAGLGSLLALGKRARMAVDAAPDAAQRPLDRLVALQRADGTWALDDALAQALGWRDAKELRKAIAGLLAGDPDERTAATALALAWLARECTDTEDEWRLLADKSQEWLARTTDGALAWLERAREVLGRR